MSPGELRQVKDGGTGKAFMKEEPKMRNIIATPDYREYYIKHASSMGSKEDFRLICANVQALENIFNNVSLWMAWPFAKSLGIFIMMEVRKYEEKYGEIKIDDIVALKNYSTLLEHLSTVKKETIEKMIKDIEGDLVEISFTCDNEKCKKINILRIPRQNLPKPNMIIGIKCPNCGNDIKVRYKAPKKEKK